MFKGKLKPKNNGDHLFFLATQHYQSLRWTETVEAIEQALACGIQKYDLAQVYVVLGNSLSQLSRKEEALAAHKKSVAINPKHVTAWRDYGITLRKIGDYEGAEDCYERALEIKPNDELTIASLGALYIFRERPQKAIDIIETAIHDGVESGTTYGNLALALAMVGRFDDADLFLSKAVAQGFPSWREIRQRINDLREYHEGLNIHDTSWLPPAFSQCGAALSDATVRWVSASTFQCGYCGSVNRK